MVAESDLRAAAAKSAELTAGLPPEVRGALAAEVFRVLIEVETRGGHPARDERRTAEVPPRGTLGEYLAELGPLSHPTRLVAIASLEFQHNGVDGLTADEFLAAYSEIRCPRPQNLSSNLTRCIRRGWLAEGPMKDGQKTWRVTQRGISTIESLPREGV